MTVYIRTSPPSPHWQIKFKLPQMAKAVRQSSGITIDRGGLTLEEADELRRSNKMRGKLKESYDEALAFERALREAEEARVQGRFKATPQAPRDFMTPKQAAEYLGLTQRKLTLMRLPLTLLYGHPPCYSRETLDRIIGAREMEPWPPRAYRRGKPSEIDVRVAKMRARVQR